MWENYLSPIPGVGKMIHSFLHPEEGYDTAAKEMEKYWNEAQKNQQPYNQAGQQQIKTLTNAQSDLLNPTKLLSEWMNSYQTSPYAQTSLNNARNAGLDAAAQQGLAGSSASIANIQQSASDIMNKDRDTYLKDLMDKYINGIGIGKDIFNTGAQTAGNLGTQGLNTGKFNSEATFGSTNAPGELFKTLLAIAAKMYGQGNIGT